VRNGRGLVAVAIAVTACAGTGTVLAAKPRGLPILDNTPPTNVDGTPSRDPDKGGWYNHPVVYRFNGEDDQSGIASCDTVTYDGPDSAEAKVKGGCNDKAGNRTEVTDSLKYDGTKPSVGATPSRPPDHGGWYTHPVSFSFHGSDATSGIAGCTNATYSGPDDGSADVNGSCTDMAGNVGSRSLDIKYDATPPAQPRLFAVPTDHAIGLSWTASNDSVSFVVTRALATGTAPPITIYRGSGHNLADGGLQNGTKYTYTLFAYDAAGNFSASGIGAVPDGSTLRPFIDTQVSRPPLLSWKRVKSARYYNLQLWRGKVKVLSTWPRGAKLQLQLKWSYNGRRFRLLPGLYRWYVWPGIGRPAGHRYGPMVGSSSFRVLG
jgi:hypothetical protein